LVPRLVDVETKVIHQASVGKGKGKLEAAEQALYDAYGPDDLREKAQIALDAVQACIDEGRLSAEEKPQVLEQLQAKLAVAEADGKAKLQQKLEKMIASVSVVVPTSVQVTDIVEIDAFKKKLATVRLLEKKPFDTLNEHERKKIEDKPAIKESMHSLEQRSRMWFETDEEFKARLEQALVNVTSMKLEQKRLEQKDTPQKPVPQPKKKEKRVRAKIDPHELFGAAAPEEGEEDEILAPSPVETPAPSPAPSPALAPSPSPAQEVSPEAQDVASPPVAASPPPVNEEALDGADPLPEAPLKVKVEKVQKAPQPPPKKREKKKFTKVDASSLGFELST